MNSQKIFSFQDLVKSSIVKAVYENNIKEHVVVMGTCLDNRNVRMHLITLRLVFAPTGPNGVRLWTKESTVKESYYNSSVSKRENEPYNKRNHRDEE